MRVLIVGGGGREHAIAWKLKLDNPDMELFCAPGNGGIRKLAECVPIPAGDIKGLKRFAGENGIDLTVAGSEEPLVNGIVDEFGAMPVFGPSAKGAMLEGGKSFAKRFMKKYGVPTAEYEAFSDYGEAVGYARKKGAPLVIKADGLAAGKGVTVCGTVGEAEAALKESLVDGRFGESGRAVVIEEALSGPEVTVLAFADGNVILPMVSAKDHKRAHDGGMGPNTGGMGTISPAPDYTAEIEELTKTRIIAPTLNGLKKEGIDYRGVLYFGLMLTKDGPKVIEYNCRFGDPETQVVLPRLENNLLDVMWACVNGGLDKISLKWRREAAACIVLASGGYPGAYKKGLPIYGLDSVAENEGLIVFHAGTAEAGGKVVADGGRVLGVSALAGTVKGAAEKAYGAIGNISFEGAWSRSDIGRQHQK